MKNPFWFLSSYFLVMSNATRCKLFWWKALKSPKNIHKPLLKRNGSDDLDINFGFSMFFSSLSRERRIIWNFRGLFRPETAGIPFPFNKTRPPKSVFWFGVVGTFFFWRNRKNKTKNCTFFRQFRPEHERKCTTNRRNFRWQIRLKIRIDFSRWRFPFLNALNKRTIDLTEIVTVNVWGTCDWVRDLSDEVQ